MSEKKGCEKMSQKHQKSQARSISVNAIAEKPLLIWDYVAFAAIAVFCFLVFQQSDLLHTAGCSYGYLNGHFRDFYDYCGTFDIHPAYMPSFYLIFAIWNIPMRLFGVVTFPTENLPVLAILLGLAGYVQDGVMSQEGIHRLCGVLIECRMLLSQFEMERSFVFATASLRNIQNTREAVDQIFLMTGFSVDVISGQAEAYLDYYGVMVEAPLENGLLFDIGGGSTELVTMAHDGPGVIESLPIGSLTLAKEYVGKVFPKQSECEKIQARIRKELKKRKLHRLPAHTSLCGVGGTARSLLLLAQEQQELPDTQRLLTTGQLKKLEKLLWKKDNTARELLLKNCPDRLHTIYAGMLILDELVELSQCETIYISQYGVREGYLRRELARKRKA